MTSWEQLHKIAAADHLRLDRSRHSFGQRVTVITETTIECTLLTISADDLPDDDNDKVLRASLEAGLRALKALNT